MTSPCARPAAFALAALSLLGSACTTGPDSAESARSAVVFTTADGDELEVGTYDAQTGELVFVDRAQDDMRERLLDASYIATVAIEGESTEIDLEAGIVFVDVDLEDGTALELRVARPGARTLTIGELVLHDADTFRIAGSWKLGNKIWSDDWLAPV